MGHLFIRFVLAVVATITFAAAQNSPEACATALDYHFYALQALGECEDPATQNTTLCELVGEFYEGSAVSNASSIGHSAHPALDQLSIFNNPAQNIQPWQNYLAQNTMAQSAEIGQIAYLASQVNAAWQPLTGSTLTDDQYSGIWGRAWWELGDAAHAAAGNASNGYSWASRRDAYFIAANYMFTGQWPLFTTPEAVQYMDKAVQAVRLGLQQWQGINASFFSVPFSADGLSAKLPGIFITPDASQQLPLLIFISGTDYPKEALLLQTAAAALERGYAAIFFDGPGQGEVIRQPPHMPFSNSQGAVVGAILDYATSQLQGSVDPEHVALLGFSLGGYLAGVACAELGTRIQACVLNPARTEMPSAYNVVAEYGVPVYGALQYVAEQDPDLLPPGYAQVFSNLSSILEPLLMDCDADSGVAEAFAAPLEAQPGPVDPELLYLAVGYGGAFSSNASGILNGVWAGYRNVQGFTNDHIGEIAVPVLNYRSLEDDLLGGEEEAFQSQLSTAIQAKSQLITFDGASGAALHDQAGAFYASTAVQYAFLDPIMMPAGSDALQSAG